MSYLVMLEVKPKGQDYFSCCPIGSNLTLDDCVKCLEESNMQHITSGEVRATLIPPRPDPCVQFVVLEGKWSKV